MAQQVKNPPAKQEMKDMRVGSLGHKDPWRKEMATHSSILVWEKSHGQRRQISRSSEDHKASDMTEQLTATHESI